MKWLKAVFLSILFLFLMPFVFSTIEVELPEKYSYNLGDGIVASVSIIEDQDYSGFLKAILECGKYKLQYYTTPLNLEANFRTQIQVPELPLFESMKGNCNIEAEFEDTEGDKISRAESKTFIVTDELNISTNDIIYVLPNEKIELEGIVKKNNGENLDTGDVKISFNNKEFDTKVEFGNFKFSLALDPDLDIGNYPILIAVEDKHNNYANKVVQLNVLPVATRIENRLDSESVKPGEALKARVILYGHTGRAMNGTINVDLINTEGKKIVSKEVESLDYINYEFNRNALPGTYTIISKMDNLKEETNFEIEAVKEISMSYNDQKVIIENVGNVDYEDETTIIVENDDKKYLINKKLKLEPGETVSIDLSKEVPSGTYDVVLPQVEASEEEENITEQKESTNVIEEVEITDNRPAYKKVGSGLGSITGAVAGAGGYVASRPIAASAILIILIVLIVLYYSKGFIIDKVKRKKPEDTTKLFEDFKYQEKEK